MAQIHGEAEEPVRQPGRWIVAVGLAVVLVLGVSIGAAALNRAEVRAVAMRLLRHFRGPALPAGFASGNGRLEAVEYNIATKRPGRIATVAVREGDMVQPGRIAAVRPIAVGTLRRLQPDGGRPLRRGEVEAAVERLAGQSVELGVYTQRADIEARLIEHGFHAGFGTVRMTRGDAAAAVEDVGGLCAIGALEKG